MITGASTADVAVILIDARLGILKQSRRHAYIASLLGIKELIVCINKMDLVNFSLARFEEIREEFKSFLSLLKFSEITFIPISAKDGDNVVVVSDRCSWYSGPTVLSYLEEVKIKDGGGNFRFPVQMAIRESNYRGFAGMVEGGNISKGDSVIILPSCKRSKVKAIDCCGEVEEAKCFESVVLRLEDEIDISRGDMIVDKLPMISNQFEAYLVWMGDLAREGGSYLLKHTTSLVRVDLDKIHFVVNLNNLEQEGSEELLLNDIGYVSINSHRSLFLDLYDDNRFIGSFILIDEDTNDTVAAGMICKAEGGEFKDLRSLVNRNCESGGKLKISKKRRELAYNLEKKLCDEGFSAIVLDGIREDNIDLLVQMGLYVIYFGGDDRYPLEEGEALRMASEGILGSKDI
jgi:sulfate adenylyltransferase large subunit